MTTFSFADGLSQFSGSGLETSRLLRENGVRRGVRGCQWQLREHLEGQIGGFCHCGRAQGASWKTRRPGWPVFQNSGGDKRTPFFEIKISPLWIISSGGIFCAKWWWSTDGWRQWGENMIFSNFSLDENLVELFKIWWKTHPGNRYPPFEALVLYQRNGRQIWPRWLLMKRGQMLIGGGGAGAGMDLTGQTKS